MAIDELDSLALREFDLIHWTIHSFLARSSISQPYKDALWKVLACLSPPSDQLPKSSLTILFPRLSYQVCAGVNPFPNEISAAWYLFYLAADLMDSVQDRDRQPNLELDQLSIADWLSFASGFFFIANALLAALLDQDYDLEAVRSVLQTFQHKLLEMCEGQQRDVSMREVSLEDYLNLTRKKSGSFFSLACTAGARMASAEFSCLERLSAFGSHLGCIIQILDDLQDWHQIQSGDRAILPTIDWYKNLPTVYTLEVLPSKERAAFRGVLERLANHPDEWQNYLVWVNRSGAAMYTMTILLQEVELARNALKSDLFLSTPRDTLLQILNTLVGET